MVQQIIKYSDGSETVINYKGVIENGVLIPDEPEKEMETEIEKETEAVKETEEVAEPEIVESSDE